MIEPQKIKLGGKEWYIPELAIRQLRKVRAPLIEMNERMRAVSGGGPRAFVELSEEDYERLVVDVVYHGLTRGQTITREEFLDLPASEAELIDAWFVVRDQSGVFVKKESAQGEALATMRKQTENRIGTA